MFSFKRPVKKKIVRNSNEVSSNSNTVVVRPPVRRPKKVVKEKSNVSGFYAASYKMLGNRVQFLTPRLGGLESKLEKGMMMIPFEAYLSAMVIGGVIAGIVSLVASAIFVNIINLQPIELRIFFPFIAGAAGFEAVFGLMYKYPQINVGNRNRRLAEEAPYFIGYMATLAASGLTLEGIFKAIAKEETKEEFVKSARYVVRDLDMLGMDIITALTNLIGKTPPGAFNELLEGLISTVQSGGNLKEFFTACAKVQMEEKKMVLQKMTSSLGIVAEIYTILLVVFPLMAVIMFSIMATMAKTFLGFDITTVMMLITYMMVPLCGVMIVIMVDGMVPKR